MKSDGSNIPKYRVNQDKHRESWFDVIEMQTSFALWQSMKKSKTLTLMVIVGLAVIVGFLFFVKGLAIN